MCSRLTVCYFFVEAIELIKHTFNIAIIFHVQ
jgi:hypothetical protein